MKFGILFNTLFSVPNGPACRGYSLNPIFHKEMYGPSVGNVDHFSGNVAEFMPILYYVLLYYITDSTLTKI